MPTEPQKTKNENLVPRPPVVAVMGHVDHGKSTLLDYIRKTNVAEGEVGGITQKIGAYEVEHTKPDGTRKAITFLDTPGHEAFGSIRSMSVNAADIAVLVVSAEDGVMPQTLDAYSCIKKTGVPFIVAINKIDKPNADIERTKGSLAEKEIYLEGFGGDVPWASISAKTGAGVNELLELIDLVAEINDTSGNPNIPASGFIVETERDNRRGPTATAVIKNGTLRQGDVIVSDQALSSIKIMEDDKGKIIKEASMGAPVRIIGWNVLPNAGSPFITVGDKKEAETIIEKNREQDETKKNNSLKKNILDVENADSEHLSTSEIFIPIIIKADVGGSIEAIIHELKKIESARVKTKILNQDVGDISEADAKLAESAKDSIIIGFNVNIDSRAKTLIERGEIETKTFNIIYKLSEWLGELIIARTPKIKTEERSGVAKIIKIFSKDKDKQIIGGKVIDGAVAIGDEVKVMRREEKIGVGKIRELQRQKVRTENVQTGAEFGALIDSKITIAPGDTIEPFTIVEK